MQKVLFLLFFFWGFINTSHCQQTTFHISDQSISSLFLKIPPNDTMLDTGINKEYLIKFRSYQPKDTTGQETEIYHIDTILTNYLQFEDSYTTGQAAYSVYGLKRFVKKDGTYILVFANFGGVHNMYGEREIKVYDVIGNNVIENKQGLLPSSIDVKEFLTSDTPDTLWEKVMYDIDNSCDFVPELPNTLKFTIDINEPLGSNPIIDDKYVKTYTIEYNWNGTNFSKKIMPKAKE
jgi:hypothetical protein